jgi:DNA (cytosine-5)-methyltransferase 1
MENNQQLNCVDLFCGAGGMSKGFELAGIKCLLGIDNNEPAIRTFKRNHKDAEALVGDLREISTEELLKYLHGNRVDIVCGGPPCQGFSTVGTNNAEDSRNSLFLSFVRIVRDILPDFIILENVTGLLSRNNEKTLFAIIHCFEAIGYHIEVRVLSAHHYGVPQKRRRTIFLGNRYRVNNIFPIKSFKDSKIDASNLPNPHTVKWAFDNLISKDNKYNNHDLDSTRIKNDLERQRLHYIPQGHGIRYETDQTNYLPKNLWFDVDWAKITEGRFRQTRLQRIGYDDCSPTINTGKTAYYHPVEDRYLTAREAAAIQSFPADFEFAGTVSQQWRQIGNAVPPLLAKAIGEAILKLSLQKDSMREISTKTGISGIRKLAFNYNNDISQTVETTQLPLPI